VKKPANKRARPTLAQAIAKLKIDDVRVDREEWDFSACPDEQSEACYFYEFARECPHEIRAVRAQRDQLKDISRDNAPEQTFWHSTIDIFVDWPEFPDTPFLCIPKAERTRRIANAQRMTPPVQADLGGLIRLYAGKPPTSKTIKYGYGEIAAFLIDRRNSDEKLVRGFRQWLKNNKSLGAAHMVRKGKGSSHEQRRKDLKALGAWRLLEQMRWEDAHTYTLEILKSKKGQPQGLFSGHALAWARARKHAQETIANICAFLKRLT
jgi:hypothetical protein